MRMNKHLTRRGLVCLALLSLFVLGRYALRLNPVSAAQPPTTQTAQDPPARRQASTAPTEGTTQTFAPNSPAATITVSSLADGAPANNGQCTLREALTNANNNNQSGSTDCTAGSGADTINISVTGTINLTGALPAISESLTLNGPGALSLTVRRNTGGDYNIFNINGGVTATIAGMTISNGKSNVGGGINNGGNLTINNCAITANEATGNGGGVHNISSLTVTNTTFSGNTASDGGGLFTLTGTATLTNCTFSGNTATVFTGAITHVNFGGPMTNLSVTNCTIANNTGVTEGGIATVDQGGPATTTLKNTIVANNSAPNLSRIGAGAVVTSQGNNLASDNGNGLLNQASDKLNTNALLAPLGTYGGPTQTLALLPGSPAIDTGTATGAPANDQRGFARGVNGKGFAAAGVDIGAYEVRPKFINVTTGNNANSGATLATPWQTIAHGIANAAVGDDLIIASGTYPENNLIVDKSINFHGAGAANTIVNAGQLNRVFQINGGQTVGITNLNITNGKSASGQFGGGINNSGTLSLANCIVSSNTASNGYGGGIFSTGLLTISNTTINANSASNGGGIASVFSTANLTVVNSLIHANTTTFQAGGVYIQDGVGTLTNSTISANVAGTWPGGLFNLVFNSGQSSFATLTNCTVVNNQSDGTAGGIATIDNGGAISTITQLKNTIVSGNVGPSLIKSGTNSTVTSLGNNLSSDNGGGFLNGTGDLINTNPLLGVLAWNGGPTRTHLPQAGSPAINAGSNTGAPATDQRGVKRPVGANTDIGAVEVSSGTCTTRVIYPSSVARGAIGAFYSQQLTATGGTGPYVFAVAEGSTLPAGLSLSSSGSLSGTPTASGNQTFSLTVLDQTGCLSTQAFAMYISASGCTIDSATPITIGQTLTGQLLPGDCTAVFGDGSPSDLFSFSGTAGQQVAISMNSTDVDSYLALFSPALQSIAQDDNGGGGTNARIPANSGFFTLPATGTYYIVADGSGQTGNYTVTLSGPPNNGLQFYPLPRPVRLLDTRAAQGNCDSVTTPIAAGGSITTQARITCEGITIPASAQAIVGNITVINQTAQAGYLTLYPTGQSAPLAANMIYGPNGLLSNNFTVGLSGTGQFNIFGERTIHVIVDVSGYYAPPGQGGLYFHPLAKPVRLLDTRASQGNCDSVSTPIAAGTSITTQARQTCEGLLIPPTAQAIVGNATVINGSGQAGYLTIYPDGVTPPLAANMIYLPGNILSNAFTVGLSADGKFNIFGEKTIDMVVDVAGYYSTEPIDANGPGLLFNALSRPLRILDTRAAQGNCDTVAAPITGGTSLAAPARLTCESLTIPVTAQAVLGNVTVINQTASAGFLTMYPDGVAQPLAANMIYFPGQVLSNAFVVGLNSSTGQYRVFAERTLEAIVDVSGFFAP